jgi:hypothetical protein
MRKTLITATLLLAISCPAFAGEMATPGSPTTPPSQTASAVQESTGGEMFNGVMHTPGVSDSLTEVALDLLAVLPLLL